MANEQPAPMGCNGASNIQHITSSAIEPAWQYKAPCRDPVDCSNLRPDTRIVREHSAHARAAWRAQHIVLRFAANHTCDMQTRLRNTQEEAAASMRVGALRGPCPALQLCAGQRRSVTPPATTEKGAASRNEAASARDHERPVNGERASSHLLKAPVGCTAYAPNAHSTLPA